MNDYFEHVVQKMTIEEMEVLGVLYEKDINASFKALSRQKMQEMTNLSPTEFRRVIEKLIATHFIDVVQGKREHRLFLTSFGQEALEKSIEGVE